MKPKGDSIRFYAAFRGIVSIESLVWDVPGHCHCHCQLSSAHTVPLPPALTPATQPVPCASDSSFLYDIKGLDWRNCYEWQEWHWDCGMAYINKTLFRSMRTAVNSHVFHIQIIQLIFIKFASLCLSVNGMSETTIDVFEGVNHWLQSTIDRTDCTTISFQNIWFMIRLMSPTVV